MKTCVISIQKANDKLDEWINHYLNLGFSHLFIIDNNDFENRISNTKYDNVTIIPYNNVSFKEHSFWAQNVSYEYSYKYIKYLNFDYVYICDSDEFLILKHHNNISDFIQEEMINKGYDWLSIYWDVYDDNDIVYLEDEKDTLINTYTRQQSIWKPFDNKQNECSCVKIIAKCKNEFNVSACAHGIDSKLIENKIYGEEHILDPNIAVINHYRTRCLEWYIATKVKELYFSVATNWHCTDALEGYALFNHITPYKLEKFFKLYKQYIGEEYPNKDQMILKYNKQ